MPIKVIVAQPHGFCGGVKRAIEMAEQTGKDKKFQGETYLCGEIVHNPHVVDGLTEKGIMMAQTLAEIPEGSTVIFRAHGVKPEAWQQAKARNLNIVDATCPLVAQSHERVKKLVAKGKKILYLASDRKGDKYHDEAEGVYGEAPEAIILTTLKELPEVGVEDPKNTVVLTQTTLSVLETKKAWQNLKKKYPAITIEPHICPATTQRQEAVIALAKEVKVIVIVGSPTSSNSKRLKEVAKLANPQVEVYMVDTADELKADWFKRFKGLKSLKVGVSSGASTPEELLKEVVEKIKTF